MFRERSKSFCVSLITGPVAVETFGGILDLSPQQIVPRFAGRWVYVASEPLRLSPPSCPPLVEILR